MINIFEIVRGDRELEKSIDPRTGKQNGEAGPTLVADVPSQEQTLFDLYIDWVN